MGFSEDRIEALKGLGIEDDVIFATGPDGDGFSLADGMQAEITENVIVGTLSVPEVKSVMCRAVLQLQTDCEGIEKKGAEALLN